MPLFGSRAPTPTTLSIRDSDAGLRVERALKAGGNPYARLYAAAAALDDHGWRRKVEKAIDRVVRDTGSADWWKAVLQIEVDYLYPEVKQSSVYNFELAIAAMGAAIAAVTYQRWLKPDELAACEAPVLAAFGPAVFAEARAWRDENRPY